MDLGPPETIPIKTQWLLPRKVFLDTDVKILKKYSKLIRAKKVAETRKMKAIIEKNARKTMGKNTLERFRYHKQWKPRTTTGKRK